MSVAFPGESQHYREARERLLEKEIELRRSIRGRVAGTHRIERHEICFACATLSCPCGRWPTVSRPD